MPQIPAAEVMERASRESPEPQPTAPGAHVPTRPDGPPAALAEAPDEPSRSTLPWIVLIAIAAVLGVGLLIAAAVVVLFATHRLGVQDAAPAHALLAETHSKTDTGSREGSGAR